MMEAAPLEVWYSDTAVLHWHQPPGVQTAFTSDATGKWKPLLHTLWTIWFWSGGFPQPPVRFDNLLELLTEFRKTLSLWLHFYFRGYRLGPGKWRDTQSEVLDSPKHRVSGPFVKSGCIILLALHSVHQSGSSTECWCPEFLSDVDMIGQTIGYMIQLNL